MLGRAVMLPGGNVAADHFADRFRLLPAYVPSCAFGISVIDDDLGCSAAGGVQCAGFERMVAEVCLSNLDEPECAAFEDDSGSFNAYREDRTALTAHSC